MVQIMNESSTSPCLSRVNFLNNSQFLTSLTKPHLFSSLFAYFVVFLQVNLHFRTALPFFFFFFFYPVLTCKYDFTFFSFFFIQPANTASRRCTAPGFILCNRFLWNSIKIFIALVLSIMVAIVMQISLVIFAVSGTRINMISLRKRQKLMEEDRM